MKLSDADKVRIAGQRMSNWLYNMNQSGRFNLQQAEVMKEMVDEWDQAAKLLPRSKPGRKRK